MGLSSEDVLRLNVLLANRPQAIRIDESRLTVHGLSESGEASVKLNPVGREDQYLREVKELLSGHVLGSPGGYPVYLQRWTRMGQMRDESLEQLLLLGEPEAVVAAVCAPGLTDELARRAWWAMPEAENARHMLANPAVAGGEMGPVLAEYLVEYLPFESDPEIMIESVRLVLQPGLINEQAKRDLWQKAARRSAYLVGFLMALPDQLPLAVPECERLERYRGDLDTLSHGGNHCARLLLRVLAAPGQAFLETVEAVLKKPATQEVVSATLDLVAGYFRPLRPDGDPDLPIEELIQEAESFCGHPDSDTARCLETTPGLKSEIRAMRVLSGIGYGVLRPALGGTTAIGSLMRRKLEPMMQQLGAQLEILRGKN